jgi:hypothetical protein
VNYEFVIRIKLETACKEPNIILCILKIQEILTTGSKKGGRQEKRKEAWVLN